MSYDTATRRIVSHEWTGIPVDDSEYPADPVVEAQVDKWEAKVSALVDVPIGRSTKPILTARGQGADGACHARPLPLGFRVHQSSAACATLCRKASCWRAMSGM